MSLSIGIVGLPNVGKSTLFTALTKKTGLAANYPFATIDDGLEIPVPMEDTELLLARIERVCAQVRGATDRIDRALKRAGYERKPRTRASQSSTVERGQSATMTTKRLKSMLASFDAGARGASNNARKGA